MVKRTRAMRGPRLPYLGGRREGADRRGRQRRQIEDRTLELDALAERYGAPRPIGSDRGHTRPDLPIIGERRSAAAGDGVGVGRQLVGNHIASIRKAEAEDRSEEHTSELQSLMRISYAVFCLKKKKTTSKE